MTNYNQKYKNNLTTNYTHKFSVEKNAEQIKLFAELQSYISWVERGLLLLEDKSRLNIKNDVSFEITREMFITFSKYFKEELKPTLNSFNNEIMRKPLNNGVSKNLGKLLELIKKPFNEIVDFPNRSPLSTNEYNSWINALLEALENSTSKLLKYFAKFGYIETLPIIKAETDIKKTITEKTNYLDNEFCYKDPYVGGKMPSASAA